MQQKYSDAQQQHAKANASQVMLVKGLKMTHAQLKQMKQVQTNVVKQETTKTLVEMKKVAASLFTESVMGKLQESAKLLNAMTVKYKKEQMERKKLHNVIQELKGNIRVYMRYVAGWRTGNLRHTFSTVVYNMASGLGILYYCV